MAKKVAIDAGHGSKTAGKRTPDGYREHWINVKCAYYFEKALKRCGIDTVRIGWDDTNAKDDEDVSLTTRQKQVKKADCDISVSWHANAHGNGSSYTSAKGVETLIHDNSSRVGDSKSLATKVQKYLVKGTDQANRGVKKQALSMCNCTAMGTKASILIEIGFMTNKVEAELMKTEAFCKEQAEEAAHGVCDYFKIEYVEEQVEFEPYKVKILTDNLKVRAGAGTSYKVNTTVDSGEVYTIVKEKKSGSVTWGKLKSGSGWIALKYAKKVD